MLDTPLKSLYFRGALLVTIAMFRCEHWMLFSGYMFLFVFPPIFTKHHWNLFNPLKSNRTQFSHSNSLKSCRHSFDKSQLKVIFCSNVGDASNFAIYNFLNCFERSKVPASQVQKLNQIFEESFRAAQPAYTNPTVFPFGQTFHRRPASICSNSNSTMIMSTIKAFKTIYYLFRNVKLFDFDDQTVKVQRKAGPSLPGKYIRGNSHTLPRGWMYWVVHCTSPLGSVSIQLPFTSLLWQSTCSIHIISTAKLAF